MFYFQWIPKRTFWAVIAMLLLTAHLPAHAQSAERAPRRRAVDIEHIQLVQQFDWREKSAKGTVSIRLVLLENSRYVALDAAYMTIHAVRLADMAQSLNYQYAGDERDDALVVDLGQTRNAGDQINLEIEFDTHWANQSDPENLWGSYGKGLRFFQPSSTEPHRRRQIWTMGEPQANRYWFPAYDAPDDLRTFELVATVDTPLTVISNGILVETRSDENGRQSFHWKSSIPHANHQSGMVIGTFWDHVQQFDQTLLHTYGYPDEKEAVIATTVRLPDMFRFFSEKTGQTYPFPAYSQVTIQEFPWGGGHHAGFSAISENMIDDFGTHADFFYLWDGVEAQDLAAQWFCNMTTPRDWEHAWLCKSLAIYFDCLYTEFKNGRDEMLLWNRNFQQTAYLGDWYAGIRRPVVTKKYDKPETMTHDNYAALRGAMALHLLRMQLGEEKWWRAIRLYLEKNRHKTVETRDFMAAVETAAGVPMDWFFDQWIFKMGHPIFEIKEQYTEKKQELTISVAQIQTEENDSLYSYARYFQGNVQIAIDDRIETVWVEPKALNTYRFVCPGAPKVVVFDHQSAWIKEVKIEKTVDQWIEQFKNSRDVTAQRAAMQNLSASWQNNSLTPTQKINIKSSFQDVITGEAYWRIRYSALLTLQNLLVTDPSQPTILDKKTRKMLKSVAQTETSWNRAAAIAFLGAGRNRKDADFFIGFLQDSSDRVVNAAAIALGKTQSPKACDVLMRLKNRPSWKNQSWISTLNGLKELNDPRGANEALSAYSDLHGAHWTLATPIWDYRLAAAETLAALQQGDQAFAMTFDRLKKACQEGETNDIFINAQFIIALKAKQGGIAFEWLKKQYADNSAVLPYVIKYEDLWRQTQPKP